MQKKQLEEKVDNARKQVFRVVDARLNSIAKLNERLDGKVVQEIFRIDGTLVFLADDLVGTVADDGQATTSETDLPDAWRATAIGDDIMIVASDGQVRIVQPKTVPRPVPLPYPTPNPAISAAGSYQSRLYTTDTQDRNIWRANRTAAGFGSVTRWLKNSNDELKTAHSLAIDGHVYVAVDNAVLRFLSGQLDEFTLETLDPPLIHPGRLWTNENTAQLYVLDRQNQRILVYRKSTGALVRQYVSPTLGSVQAFVVEEYDRRIIVSTERELFSLAIE